jgi:cobalamin biosynthesis protein CobT
MHIASVLTCMTDQQRSTRRRVLQLTGVAASTALVAGCGGPGGDDNDTGNGDDETEEETGNGQDTEDEPAGENETNETGNMTNETNETGNMTNETENDSENNSSIFD